MTGGGLDRDRAAGATPVSRNAVILCTDRRMLVPALFVASSVRRHATASPTPFDIVIVAEPGAAGESERRWMDAHRILLHEDLDFAKYRDVGIFTGRLSVATLIKVLLPELFEGRYDRILYLDCDLTIHEDLGGLFRLDLGEHALAAQRRGLVFPTPLLEARAHEHFSRLGMTKPFHYLNSGVLCIDVAAWRRQDLTARTLDFVRRNRELCVLVDEDSLNGVLDGRFTPISPVWNMQPPRREMMDVQRFVRPAIVHYVGYDKPWKRFGEGKPLFPDMTAYRLYREFLRETPWPDWLAEQWTAQDLRQGLLAGAGRLARRFMVPDPDIRAYEPSRSERRAYVARFAEHCALGPFADVDQGIVVRDGGRLRLRKAAADPP